MNDVVSCTKAVGVINYESEMTAKNLVIVAKSNRTLLTMDDRQLSVWHLLCAFYVSFLLYASFSRYSHFLSTFLIIHILTFSLIENKDICFLRTDILPKYVDLLHVVELNCRKYEVVCIYLITLIPEYSLVS
jgi:hypothetical protein